MREVLRLKNEQLVKSQTPPTYLKANLHEFDLRSLDMDFDVIYIDPPLEECVFIDLEVDKKVFP
jgi:16S rRNA G966 N2-methylase RsmD